MATQELTVVQHDLPALVPTAVAKARLQEIRQFVKEELREGIDQDFAVIPGTGKKPSLLQPGAEKIIEKLGLAPTFPVSSVKWAYENHEAGEYMVDVLCQLVNLYTGLVQAECWGSAGRSAQEELDASNAKAREYNKPERSLSFRDKGLARNTAFKLAQKSALVGATLKAARLAVEFTQDVEDFNRPAAPKPAAPDPTGEHYCPIHKTEWFKRGKMQRFAHPIGDTGKWCNEDDAKVNAHVAETWEPEYHEVKEGEDALTETFGPQDGDDISPNDLIELAKQADWSSGQLLTRMREKFQKPGMSLPNFTAAQRLETATMIRNLLADQELAVLEVKG